MKHYTRIAPVVLLALLLAACGGDEQSPGLEYMPDMYRSPAIEAYVDYGMDPYHYGDSLALAQRSTPSARQPVEGTIPFNADPEKAALNFPYPYPNTNEGYEQAGLELKTPFARTEETVAEGKVLYDKFCDHCHGKDGQGDGPVVVKGGHAPPFPYDGPAIKGLPEGKIFHSITLGKNMMGGHASQLNKEERWKLVHYVQTLQGYAIGAQAAVDSAATAEVLELTEEGTH